MTNRQIAQKVIDFEFSRTHIKDQISREREEEQTQLVKFTDWNLENVMHDLGLWDPTKYKVKWIGFEEGKFTDAFVYCLFKGCRSGFAAKNGIFIKLKYCLYQMACKFIKLGDQKNLVQVLCGAQYAKDLTNFLNRNPVFLKLFNKLLKNYLDSQFRGPHKSQIHKLKQFADNFDFIKFRILNENIGQLLHFDQKFYIIYEKQCCFVIEVEKQKQPVIKLNKILQSDHQNQPFVKGQPKSDNPEQIKNEQRDKIKSKGYAVPKFILMNNKKKHKKSARYTEIQIQQDLLAEFRGAPQNTKVKTLDPILTSRAEHIISLQTIPKFIDVRGSLQPFTSIKQYSSDQKNRRQHTQTNIYKFSKNTSLRGKPGFFQLNKGKLSKKSKQKSPNDVTRIDEKNFKKPGLKKIQLSLKKLISPSSKTGYYQKETNTGQQYSSFVSNIYNERSFPLAYSNSNCHSYEKHHRPLCLNGE